MKKNTIYFSTRAYRFACMAGLAMAAMLGMLNPAQAQSPLQADPSIVRFGTFDDVAEIQVTLNGKPVPAAEIKSMAAFADDSDYSRMFVFQKQDGLVRVKPNPNAAESGSYTLKISTTHGLVTAEILAPYDKLPGSIERMAAEQGITVAEMMQKLGLSKSAGHMQLDIQILPAYRIGQKITIALPEDADRTYAWSLNGEVALEGKGKTIFEYVPKEAGNFELSLCVREGSGIAGTWNGLIQVVPEEAQPVSATAGTTITFNPPEGFGHYIWRVNGEAASEAAIFKYTFRNAGVYTVECMADKPAEGNLMAFRDLRWEVTVTKKP